MVAQYKDYIGIYCCIWYGEMQIDCIVEDVRVQWGKPQFKVRPFAGKGSRWVQDIHIGRAT